MAILKMIPYRKLKVTVIVVICGYVTLALWSTSGRELVWNTSALARDILRGKSPENNMSQRSGRYSNSNEINSVEQEVQCDKIIPFRDISGGRISTYDLPNETDFSLGPDGRYKLPEEIVNAKDRNEMVKVILVPFSHSDPGYGRTVEQYYTESTKNVLNNMVEFLFEHRNMTFQFVETVFLERWFRDITEDRKQKVRDLISRGQLELVLGGWVMPDEAVTHYVTVIDQLIEGHLWLQENIGVSPRNAWINDPFGYSSTMPYLWKSSGIENMVILRIHQAIKHTLMRKQSLDFMWRPYWNSGPENDILCNLMPYTEYWNSGVCGPNQNICEKFNFLWLGSARAQSAREVTEENLETLAKMLHKEYKFTASMYQYKTLVVFIGEDNSFTEKVMWQNTWSNYGKLMHYINSRPEMKMKIKFGTIREYFEQIRKDETKHGTNLKFPVLSGDFFPYSDKENDYWTGYFTTRPWVKRFTREVEELLRAADRFSVLLYNHCIVSALCDTVKDVFREVLEYLRVARREVGIYQHHDGITGTSLPYVVMDYEDRLSTAFKSARKALTLTVVLLLSKGTFKDSNILADNIDRPQVRAVTTPKLLRFKNDMLKIVVANPLEKAIKAVVSFYTNKSNFNVTDAVTYQIADADLSKFKGNYHVTISVALLPFQLKTVVMSVTTDSDSMTSEVSRASSGDTSEILSIENSHMKVEFFGINGSLRSITDKNGQQTKITNDFLKYIPAKSGAYLFGPKGPAKRISEMPRPDVTLTTGPLFSQVKVAFKSGFIQKWKLYNTDDMRQTGLFLSQEITLEIEPNMVDSEIILRFKTDINNGDIFYTDQNGFQLIGRRNNNTRPIETNYYPLTTMAIIEDHNKRLTLHSAQSHGVASLENGWLEVMLDRNMAHDDGKGLGQGASERVITQTEFVIQIEHKQTHVDLEEVRYTYASVGSIVLNEQLQNKPRVFSVEMHMDKEWTSFEPKTFKNNLPCDLSIAGLKILVSNGLNINGTSLVLHRRPKHCSFPISRNILTCSLSENPVFTEDVALALDTDKLSGHITETSLSHLHMKSSISSKHDIRPKPNELRTFLIKN